MNLYSFIDRLEAPFFNPPPGTSWNHIATLDGRHYVRFDGDLASDEPLFDLKAHDLETEVDLKARLEAITPGMIRCRDARSFHYPTPGEQLGAIIKQFQLMAGTTPIHPELQGILDRITQVKVTHPKPDVWR